MPKTVVKCKFSNYPRNPFGILCLSDAQNCGKIVTFYLVVASWRGQLVRNCGEMHILGRARTSTFTSCVCVFCLCFLSVCVFCLCVFCLCSLCFLSVFSVCFLSVLSLCFLCVCVCVRVRVFSVCVCVTLCSKELHFQYT